MDSKLIIKIFAKNNTIIIKESFTKSSSSGLERHYSQKTQYLMTKQNNTREHNNIACFRSKFSKIIIRTSLRESMGLFDFCLERALVSRY